MQLVAGRITRPHGVRGEVAVEVRTDEPNQRFAVGQALTTDPPDAGPLRVTSARWHQGRLLLRFGGRDDRTSVESLVGVRLMVDPTPTDEADAYYPHELVGLAVVDVAGNPVGTVREVSHRPAHDLLEIVRPGGGSVLVPFVAALVPEVDVSAGRIVIDPPPGLVDDVDVARPEG